MTTKPKALPVGILGNGQLAQMTYEAGKKISIDCISIPPGDITAEKLKEWDSKVSYFIFESEFTNLDALKGIAASKIVPSTGVMKRLQNKLRQKELIATLRLPQAEFSPFVAGMYPSVTHWLQYCQKTFTQGLVLKWAMNGYDGKGVFVMKDKSIPADALDFCNEAISKKIEVYCEAFVSFKREFAIISTRTAKDQIVHWPLVQTVQKNSVCYMVEGPSTQLGIAPKLKNAAEEIAQKIGRSQGLVGTYAVECFETEASELLVNEIAPRVHNSGHFSIEGSTVSQFENHLRACMGMEIDTPKTQGYFLMVNLLGPKGMQGTLAATPNFKLPVNKDLYLHWYGKNEVRPLRKLGHLTFICSTRQDLQDKKRDILQWVDEIYPDQLQAAFVKL